jgi:hypothetical protein
MQVRAVYQPVRTWSNTHRAGTPLLRLSPASQTAGATAPEGIDPSSTPNASLTVQQRESAVVDLPSVPEVLAAGLQPTAGRPLAGESWTAAETSAHSVTDAALPSAYHRIDQASFISARQTEARRLPKSAMFRHEGVYWQILYEGRCIRIRSGKGLFYLRHLLQHPGEKIHVSSLAALGDHYSRPGRSTADRGLDVPPDPPLLAHDLGGVIDSRATSEYRARLDELRSDLEEASQWADFGRAASIQREIEFIHKELASAYGLTGRLRRLDDQIERTRKAVWNRIRDSIANIAKQNPILGRHLRNSIQTGLSCEYSPENDVSWTF